jgi:hypothetical protein
MLSDVFGCHGDGSYEGCCYLIAITMATEDVTQHNHPPIKKAATFNLS